MLDKVDFNKWAKESTFTRGKITFTINKLLGDSAIDCMEDIRILISKVADDDLNNFLYKLIGVDKASLNSIRDYAYPLINVNIKVDGYNDGTMEDELIRGYVFEENKLLYYELLIRFICVNFTKEFGEQLSKITTLNK